MTDKEKIEAELERLKYAYNQDADIASAEDAVGEKIAQAKYELCCSLLDFSKSLPKESASEELEEASEKYVQGFHNAIKRMCKASFKEGVQWQKEQMMKDAVESEVDEDYYIKISDGTWIDLDPSMQNKPAFGLKKGDKVKILIQKE